MRARQLQLRMSLQQLHEMGTSESTLQSAIRYHRELVNVIGSHQF